MQQRPSIFGPRRDTKLKFGIADVPTQPTPWCSKNTNADISTQTDVPNYQIVIRGAIAEDEGWPGLKPKPQEKRLAHSSSSSYRDSRDAITNDISANSPSRRFEPRSAPLVSQEDLFLRKLLSEEEPPLFSTNQARRRSVGFSDDHRDRGRDNKRSKDAPPRSNSKNRSRCYDDFSYLGVKKPTASIHPPNINTQKPRMVSGTKRKFLEDLVAPAATVKLSLQQPNPHDASGTKSSTVFGTPNTGSFASGLKLDTPRNLLCSKLGQEEVVSLLREFSRLTAQATEDAVSHARDDKKLKAYTELTSMLSKISPQAAAAITSPLADILLRHAQGRQCAEDNLQAISGVWNKVFDTFTGEISRAADLILADAVKKIIAA
ncbi:hypothetical protein C0991_003813 [Blastosporella zonata]|nr:hypothetical protein C0991_003813 [Blastosporella zonata]